MGGGLDEDEGEEKGDYLWHRCYRCGHRLAYAASMCPQCEESFDDRAEPSEWPDRCQCLRCTRARNEKS